MCEQYSFLSQVSHSAPFWNGAFFGWENGMLHTGGEMTPEESKTIFDKMIESGITKRLLKCESFTPISNAAKSVVTVHGKFEPDGIINTPQGAYMPVDHGFTHVAPVQQELSFAFIKWLGPKYQDYDFRFNFLKMYLQNMSKPHDDKTIKALILDAEIGQVCNPAGLLFSGLSHEVPLLRSGGPEAGGFELIDYIAGFCQGLRGSKLMAELVILNGLIPVLYMTETGPLKSWLEELRYQGSLNKFGIYRNKAAWEEANKVEKVRTPYIPIGNSSFNLPLYFTSKLTPMLTLPEEQQKFLALSIEEVQRYTLEDAMENEPKLRKKYDAMVQGKLPEMMANAASASAQ